LTTIAPSRPEKLSLAATRNSRLPVPWPDAGVNADIQPTVDDALHAHSGCVVTAIAPVPPRASSIAGVASDTWHFT
jgi:hypothetical protein